MTPRIKAVVRKGKIEPLEHLSLPEGTEVLVMPITNKDMFWQGASESALNSIWGGAEDDVYASLLQE